ncbi:hypothetical protein Sste5346_007339 [Sporothrix stenoceras]|uniref:Uncharacterized protein n=1 Tax=Sporothrix stenoceras TaxID=5173 RepID=A0ABR3YVB3_9PEZI
MTRRVRSAPAYEFAQLALRVLALALEMATLSVLTYLSVVFWYDHATNPIAYVGTTLALVTDAAEVLTLLTLSPPENTGTPPRRRCFQARIAWIALGDVTSAVLLFFSWIWLITHGMFWSCTVAEGSDDNKNNSPTLANCDATFPNDDLQRFSWVLPFVLAALHLVAVMVYCSALQRRALQQAR